MNVQIHIPLNYDQLTEKQLRNIAFIRYQNLGLAKELKGKALEAINKNAYYKMVRELLRGNGLFKLLVSLRTVPISEYLPHVQWVFGKIDRTKFPKQIKIKGVKYYGPYDRMVNVTVGEFSFADALWYHWDQTNNKAYLDLLCASLYRPLNANGKKRRPFSKLWAEKHANLFQKVPLKLKLAIALAYEGSRNHKVGLYPTVFPKPVKYMGEGQPPKPNYTPFGKLISHKIGYDPSKLREVETMLIDKFLGVFENELKDFKTKK